MAHVVFLRGANVGGNNVFKPTELVAALKRLEIVNIGAAGTFVVKKKMTTAEIKKAFMAKLPFEPTIAIRPGKEITDLVKGDPFHGVTFTKAMRGWVGVLCGSPKFKPVLPLITPPGDQWTIQFNRLEGAYTFGLWRRLPGTFVVPANIVDKHVGVLATVRWYETMEKIAKVLG